MANKPQHSRSLRPIDGREVSAPQVVPTREGYDMWAQIYDKDHPLKVVEARLVRRLLGDVQGLTVADIGCGTGRHALAMVEAGAKVTAVDFSEGMLSKARAKPGASTVQFVRHDLATGLPLVSRQFDRVTCCLVLEHIVDLEGLLGEMARICRVDGFVLISEPHPVMRLLGFQAQFTDPATGRIIRPGSVTHQVSDYVMAATRVGLHIDHMSEHVVDEALVALAPQLKQHVGWPLLLLIRLCSVTQR